MEGIRQRMNQIFKTSVSNKAEKTPGRAVRILMENCHFLVVCPHSGVCVVGFVIIVLLSCLALLALTFLVIANTLGWNR